MIGNRIHLAFTSIAVDRNEVIADVVSAVPHVRKRLFKETQIALGTAVVVLAVIVGGIVGIQRAQQLDVLAIHAT